MSTSVFAVGLDAQTSTFLKEHEFDVTTVDPSPIEGICSALTDAQVDAAVFGSRSRLGSSSVSFVRSKNIDVPIIGVVAGPRDKEWTDRGLRFLDAGGDDVMEAPVEAEEVAASLRARVRRYKLPLSNVAVFEANGRTLKVDLGLRRLFLDGNPLILTGLEAELMFLMASAPGLHSIKQIADNLYDADGVNPNNIHLLVMRIRRKMGTEAFVRNVWNRGYEIPGRAA